MYYITKRTKEGQWEIIESFLCKQDAISSFRGKLKINTDIMYYDLLEDVSGFVTHEYKHYIMAMGSGRGMQLCIDNEHGWNISTFNPEWAIMTANDLPGDVSILASIKYSEFDANGKKIIR